MFWCFAARTTTPIASRSLRLLSRIFRQDRGEEAREERAPEEEEVVVVRVVEVVVVEEEEEEEEEEVAVVVEAGLDRVDRREDAMAVRVLFSCRRLRRRALL